MILRSQVSILIVGAGPVGLCAGVRLLQDGFQVRILDSGVRGAGWASGGMLAPLYEMAADPACPDAYLQFAMESAALWLELAKSGDIALQSPTHFVARSDSECIALEKLATRAAAHGLEVKSAKVPESLNAMAAFEAPNERALEPRAALKRLCTLFQSLGGEFVQGQAQKIGPNWVELASGTKLESELIILANGFGAARLAESVPITTALSAVKGQMLRVAHADLSCPIIRAGRLYLLSRQGSLVIGATSDPLAPAETTIDVDPIVALLAEAKALLPSVARAPVVEAWAGLRPATPDHRPLVGATSQAGVYLATGTYRNGWLLAPAIGGYISQLISGRTLDEDLTSLLAPMRFSS